MRKITNQEFIEFINVQDDNKAINMMQPNSDCICGCLLVHLYQHLYPNEKRLVTCSFEVAGPLHNAGDNESILLNQGNRDFIVALVQLNPMIYKQVKDFAATEKGKSYLSLE